MNTDPHHQKTGAVKETTSNRMSRALERQFLVEAKQIPHLRNKHFPAAAEAAARLVRLAESRGISLTRACIGLGLKPTTVQCDAQLWTTFGPTYECFVEAYRPIKRSHLRALLEIETPVEALHCLADAVSASADGIVRTTLLEAFVKERIAVGDYQPRHKRRPVSGICRLSRSLGKAAALAGTNVQFSRVERLLEEAQLELAGLKVASSK